MPSRYPTPFPEVNDAVDKLCAGARAALGAQFVGLYIYGSLAAGGFDPRTSDVDTLVVTKEPLSEEQFSRLADMHAGLVDKNNKFTQPGDTETYYMPLAALERYNAADPDRPRYIKGALRMNKQGDDWVMHRHVLREQGITVAGPDLKPLIEPVSPEAMRRAAADLLLSWWKPMMDGAPDRFKDDFYQASVIRTICRALHTLETGELARKSEAAAWAEKNLPARFHACIAGAEAWQAGRKMTHFEDLRALIGYAAEQAARSRGTPGPDSPKI